MAAVPASAIQVLYNQGGTDLVALFAVRNVQTGDTFDVAQSGITPPFAFIRYAEVMSFTARLAALASVAGTIITMPAGMPANSSAFITVGGC